MKKLVMGLSVIALTASACWAWEPSLGAYGSYWDPKDGKSTWGGGVKLELPVVAPVLVEVRGTYFDDVFGNRVHNEELRLRDIPVEAGLAVDIAPVEKVHLLVGGGASYHYLHSDLGEVKDEWGWYGAASVQVMFTERLGIFGEGIYRGIEGNVDHLRNDIDFTRTSESLRLDGWGANAGLIVKL